MEKLQRAVRVPRELWPALWFAVAFWTGGSLPMWDDWYREGPDVSFNLGTLWSLIGHLPETGLKNFWHRHAGNVGKLTVVMAVAGGPAVHVLLRRPRKRPEAAGDYVEGKHGAVPDGRVDTEAIDVRDGPKRGIQSPP